MTKFVVYPGIDDELNFPPAVRQELTEAPEFRGTFVRFVDENGNPLVGKHVVIKVNSATGDILDIVAEA